MDKVAFLVGPDGAKWQPLITRILRQPGATYVLSLVLVALSVVLRSTGQLWALRPFICFSSLRC
jgi:hypothetical protein